MPNQSGPPPIRGAWREGAQVSAEEMKRIIDSLSQRIVGDNKTIFVRTWPGGQICIEGVDRRGGGGASAPYKVGEVPKLPAIPESGMLEVFWYNGMRDASNLTGTGDNQIWRVYAGQTRWYPTQKITNYSGVPTP